MGLTNSKTRKLPFPLFKLPSLAIVEVLKGIELLDLIQLSFASKRTGNILESLMKRNSSRNEYKLHIGCEDFHEKNDMKLYYKETLTLFIRFWNLRSFKNSKLPKVFIKLGGITVPVKIDRNKRIIATYFENPTTGVTIFLRYICRIFNPMISMNFFKEDELLIFGVLDVLKKEKAKLDNVSFNGDNPSHRLYQNLLELPCKILKLLSSPGSQFRYKPSDEPMKFIVLDISQASWNTDLEHFLHCESIFIRNTQLTEQDLNKLIRKLMESDFPLRIVFVTIDWNRRLNLKTIVEGLPVTPMNRSNTRTVDDEKCVVLKSGNGKKVIIYQVDQNTFIIMTS